jgi:hypothetical protein
MLVFMKGLHLMLMLLMQEIRGEAKLWCVVEAKDLTRIWT